MKLISTAIKAFNATIDYGCLAFLAFTLEREMPSQQPMKTGPPSLMGRSSVMASQAYQLNSFQYQKLHELIRIRPTLSAAANFVKFR